MMTTPPSRARTAVPPPSAADVARMARRGADRAGRPGWHECDRAGRAGDVPRQHSRQLRPLRRHRLPGRRRRERVRAVRPSGALARCGGSTTDEFLTLAQVAELLHASSHQLRRWQRGPDPLPVARLSRKHAVVWHAALDAWIRRRESAVASPQLRRSDARMDDVHGTAAAAAARIAYLSPGPAAPRGRPPRFRAHNGRRTP